MNKRLYLHFLRNLSANLPDLLQRQLPCGYDPARAQIPPKPVCPVIRIICLCGNMKLHLRTNFLCQHKHPRIGNDQRIRTDLFQFPEIISRRGKIFVMCKNISSHIDPHAALMRKRDAFFHFLRRKILRLCAQSEFLSPDIHGIRAKYNCCLQHFKASRRYQ